jgi:hypothetical protein
MSCWEADFVDAGYDGEEVTVRDLKYLKQIGRWGNRNAKSGQAHPTETALVPILH